MAEGFSSPSLTGLSPFVEEGGFGVHGFPDVVLLHLRSERIDLAEIDHSVMAITSAEATVRQAAHAKINEHGKQAVMAKKKRHSGVEIATKLAQAKDLATQGKLQSEIADPTRGEGDQIAELELENLRLRRQVTDLLLEKIKREEADRPRFPRFIH
jgi:hypothetical protein